MVSKCLNMPTDKYRPMDKSMVKPDIQVDLNYRKPSEKFVQTLGMNFMVSLDIEQC